MPANRRETDLGANRWSDFDPDEDNLPNLEPGDHHLDEDDDSSCAFDSGSDDELALHVQWRGEKVQSQQDNRTRLASTHQTDATAPNELALVEQYSEPLDGARSENTAEAGKAAPKPLGGCQQV
jgi:hypothetical protein